MATSTVWATSLLEEAAAIVEAEWIRLQDDQAVAERAGIPPGEEPAARRSVACLGVTTALRPSPDDRTPDDRRGSRARRRPAQPVWPTQRSPPVSRSGPPEGVVGQRR